MTTHLIAHKRLLPLLVVTVVLASALAARAGAGFFRTGETVRAYDTDTWTVWAPEGFNLLEVKGDGDTDLDCYVYRSGRLLGVDNDRTDHCVIGFENHTDGRVHIQIRNLGPVYNRYRISLD